MAVIAKTKNILFFLLTSKKIAEALGEQQAATVDCISSLQYLKIICPAFFPPCGPDSVCVCVCVHVHKHIPWPVFPIGSTKARSVGWCDSPWDAAGWDQHDCLQTSFCCVKFAWNFDWKSLFFSNSSFSFLYQAVSNCSPGKLQRDEMVGGSEKKERECVLWKAVLLL